ncbi:MAG TPA: zinc metallopeptidase [Verrucomicrobiae bacterium]|nr:zinc metallopeptidase [Verrucomicrobiae bacterium]
MIWLIFLITMGISLWAAARVKSTYARFSKIRTQSGITGAEVAQRILQSAGIDDVDIVATDSFLGDHYDPMHRRLVLSRENFLGDSPAALGVSAHECGHAIQHKIAYAPLHWRMAAVGLVNFVNPVVTFLPIVGLGIGMAPHTVMLILAIGWGVIMLFNMITLPVEFDASRRAKMILQKAGYVNEQEAVAVNKVLDAAAFTYVAAFITSLLYMLYYLLPLLLGGRRSD